MTGIKTDVTTSYTNVTGCWIQTPRPNVHESQTHTTQPTALNSMGKVVPTTKHVGHLGKKTEDP